MLPFTATPNSVTLTSAVYNNMNDHRVWSYFYKNILLATPFEIISSYEENALPVL